MFKKIPEQITRLSIVVGVVVAGVIVARYVVLPSSLIDTRLHREATIEREVAKSVQFAGAGVCAGCHADLAAKNMGGYHKTLFCEACHGPARAHTEDMSVKPTKPKTREFCIFCHGYDPSRPTGFPQINPVLHNPVKSCATCHNPHDPVPPEVPRECSACHAQIANIKTVSPHALIGCTTCHSVPAQHKVTPRNVRPTKPQAREFCGKCHGEESKRPEPPKVDLSTHGGRFLCWECHYPHLPERL